jgi:anti-sigma B factor antagonist
LEVSIRQTGPGAGGPCTIVSVSGRADVEDGAWFRRLLEVQAAGPSAEVIVDLSRLSSMDWWAALILLWVARVMHRRGGTLMLAAPRPAVAALLRSAGADQVVPVYATVREAARAGNVPRRRQPAG